MAAKYLIRFDDVTSGMAWSKFSAFEDLLNELGIKPIVGVVPKCEDKKLLVETPRNDYWDVIKTWYDNGWTIAQHGCTHIYETEDSGVLGINKKSEFSGLSYKVQFEKLKVGKEILLLHGVWQPIFMAPSHSFDLNTINALQDLQFQYVTDGYGVYPYKMKNLVAIPQLFSKPLSFGFGVYTICLHVNSMNDSQIVRTLSFIKKNREKFISFEDSLAIRPPVIGLSPVLHFLTSISIKFIRYFRS